MGDSSQRRAILGRRDFIKSPAAGALAVPVLTALQKKRNRVSPEAGNPTLKAPSRGWKIGVFADFVDDAEYGFSYEQVASLIRETGASGFDLTVRPGGLVAPERVAEDLPRAAAVFEDRGLSIHLISTGITSIKEAVARPTIVTAARLGIEYYKVGYYQYADSTRWESQIQSTRSELDSLLAAGRWEGIQALVHNHSGPMVGGATWDCWELLKPLDPDWIGAIFDPSHATVEGGKQGWILGFYRLQPRIKAVSLQDFYWEKVQGQWKMRWCPLGEGMVDWESFFQMLAATNFRGPLSLAINYDPGGRTKAERFDNSLAAAKHDVEFVQNHLHSAFG